eukprot:1236394-Amphidinium_carterae.1
MSCTRAATLQSARKLGSHLPVALCSWETTSSERQVQRNRFRRSAALKRNSLPWSEERQYVNS